MDNSRKGTTLGFGDFEVDRETRQLRKQGRRIRLQDQPFLVLCMLLDRAGNVVTREELRNALWPGSVYVDFDHGLNNAIARLREALSDDSASPTYIETLPRIGYRFIYPLETPAAEPPALLRPAPSSRPAVLWLAAGLVVALVAGLWFVLRDRPPTPAARDQAEIASIAVVPFASLSAEEEDGFFADGLSEELMTQLARIRELRVAGIASSFRFKGGQDSSAEIASALAVDHLLQGSVRRSGERVRVTARLVDAKTDRQLWSQTFERDFSDIFAIEDEIALAIASALQVRLIDADGRMLRRHGTADAEAYRLYLMGMARMRARGVRLDREGARRLFEQAIALDPGFAGAHAGLASYYFNNTGARAGRPEESWRIGLAAAERAMALAPGNTDALRVMADFEMLRFRYRGESAAYGRATALFERAIQAEPSNAYAHFDFGRAIQWSEARRALALLEKAHELDPLAPVSKGLSVLALDRLGMRDAADLRAREYVAQAGESYSSRVIAARDTYQGKLDAAVAALQKTAQPFTLDLGPILMLAGVHRSLDDRAAALATLDAAGDDPLADALRRAAILDADGKPRAAYEFLDSKRDEFPNTRLLDLPTARFALIAGEPGRAATILEQRLPGLANGTEPVTAARVLPALDLVAAWSQSGRSEPSLALLDRIEKFLDGQEVPQLPVFAVQRARAHALAGRTSQALATLESARAEGFRLICHLDLHPQPWFYVDCLEEDPAFAALRADGSFQRWLSAIRAENRTQREALQSRPATASES